MRMLALFVYAVIAYAGASLVSAAPAFADDADGKIEKVDIEEGKIVLDDGNTYKLPGEFDPEQLKQGAEIFLVYQVVDGENIITDMEVSEEATE